MANEHPFQMLFETLGRLPVAHADSVNRQAYEILYDILSVPVEKTGRCILLRAPRAGHGKTHLLARIQHHLGASHEFIPLHATFGCQIDAASVTDDALRRLLRPLPASGGLCVLDLVTRRLFSTALQPLVGSGEVPCQDREGALTALRTRPIETFDFHHPNAVTAHWARENFEVLGQRLSVELAQRCELPLREVAFWVDALFRFAATPVDNPGRLRILSDVVHTGNPGDGVLMERLEALLGMLALLMRVVLVADDLEGFSADESAALRLSAFLGALRQSVERMDVILSLNQDIWQSAFVPRLSGGLVDRLSEVVVELDPLTEDEMVALLESRVPGLGSRVLSRVDRASAGTHARGLIRAAGVAWLRATAMDSQPAVAPVAVPVAAAPLPLQSVAEGIGQPARFEAVPETPPAAPAVEFVAPPVADQPAAVERKPDPTLAIAFLAASANQSTATPDSWPAPEFSPPPAVEPEPVAQNPVAAGDASFGAASFVPVVEPEPSIPPVSPEPVVQEIPSEPAAWNVPGESAFTAAPETPASTFIPEYGNPPAATFQPAPESFPSSEFQPVSEPVQASAFQAVPEPVPAPAFQQAAEVAFTPVFQAAPATEPAPPFQPAEEPSASPVPDTDRVDDLLRQFRERYGRGSM